MRLASDVAALWPRISPRSARRSLPQWTLNAVVEVNLYRGRNAETRTSLLHRRAELLDTLAADLGSPRFASRDHRGFDQPGSSEEGEHERLGLFEAILLDRVLSGELPVQALATLNELRRVRAREVRARRRRHARAGVGSTVLVSALLLSICLLANAPARLAVGVVIVPLALGSALSLFALPYSSQTSWQLEPLIVGLLCETGVGALLIVEGIRNRVLVGDEVATLIGTATVGVPLILKAVVGRLQRR
jgi:hypothetical protein